MPTGHEKPFVSVSLPTDKGMVHARHYVSVQSKYAVLMVGSSTKRFDSPARKLYTRLATALKQDGVTALQVALCQPDDLAHSIHDVRTGIHYLCSLGSKTVILVGFDQGADAVVGAVAHESCVSGVALLSPKAADIPEHFEGALLILRPESEAALNVPKARHQAVRSSGRNLEEGADEVYSVLTDWIRNLRGADSRAA